MPKMQVPFYRLKPTTAELKAVQDVLRSGWLTSGKITREFESQFATYVGAKYAVAVNSCTAALHLSLLASGVGPGDEVITSPYTFVSSTEVILHAGAIPKFVDTCPDSLNIDLDRLPESLTLGTRAIMPVHIAGLPCDLSKLAAIGRRSGLPIIHDAAHALGAKHSGRQVGSTADFNCFSFYATKNLTTGEGGMVTTNNRHFRDKLRLLSLHGMSSGAWKRYSGGAWKYDILDLGFKYNLSDINAALGLAQLQRIEQMQRRRRQLAQLYSSKLAGVEELILPEEPANVSHAWHLYIIRLRPRLRKHRNHIIGELRKRGVETSVHFIPIYLHRYYQRRLMLSSKSFPNSYNHYRSVITLPFFVDLQEREVVYVTDCLKTILAKLRRKGA